jgi:hypothetical protein
LSSIFAVSTLLRLDVTWLDFGLCTYISGKAALEEEGRHVELPWHYRTCVPPSVRTTYHFLAEEAGVTKGSAYCDLVFLAARLIDDAIRTMRICRYDARCVPLMLPVRVPAAMVVTDTGTGTGTCLGLTHWGLVSCAGLLLAMYLWPGRGRSPTYVVSGP